MSLSAKLDRLYASSPVLAFDCDSRIVILSDCHRGQGNGADNFLPNSTIFQGALEYYYRGGYTYIELGDGDELWENRCIHTILRTHSRIFRLMERFSQECRLYMLYGNHDIIKRRFGFPGSNCKNYSCDMPEGEPGLFWYLTVSEGLVLHHTTTGQDLFLIHGHQASLLNDELWPLGRFLVRYLWRPLETIGFQAPTGAGRSVRLVEKIEKELCAYAASRHRVLIAGHTHRPVFPAPHTCPYFNDGSCVHPYCITGLEIADNCISLVRWSISTSRKGCLFIGRELLSGPESLADYG